MEGYTIKANDYVKPTEPRKEVVQRLINYYVDNLNHCDNMFCSNNCWRRTFGLQEIQTNHGWKDELWENCSISYEGLVTRNKVKVNTCEMKEFFKIWLSAGYYISKGYYSVRNKTAILYKFTQKPYINNGYTLVTEFTEDID